MSKTILQSSNDDSLQRAKIENTIYRFNKPRDNQWEMIEPLTNWYFTASEAILAMQELYPGKTILDIDSNFDLERSIAITYSQEALCVQEAQPLNPQFDDPKDYPEPGHRHRSISEEDADEVNEIMNVVAHNIIMDSLKEEPAKAPTTVAAYETWVDFNGRTQVSELNLGSDAAQFEADYHTMARSGSLHTFTNMEIGKQCYNDLCDRIEEADTFIAGPPTVPIPPRVVECDDSRESGVVAAFTYWEGEDPRIMHVSRLHEGADDVLDFIREYEASGAHSELRTFTDKDTAHNVYYSIVGRGAVIAHEHQEPDVYQAAANLADIIEVLNYIHESRNRDEITKRDLIYRFTKELCTDDKPITVIARWMNLLNRADRR